MIKKTENCLYCGEKMESETAKKKFCSDRCRVYYNREKERGTLDVSGIPITLSDNWAKEVAAPITKSLKDAQTNAIEDVLKKQRIEDIEKELKNPPKTAQIGVKNWIKIRQDELKKLKSEIQPVI